MDKLEESTLKYLEACNKQLQDGLLEVDLRNLLKIILNKKQPDQRKSSFFLLIQMMM